jgi:hypothetical protein
VGRGLLGAKEAEPLLHDVAEDLVHRTRRRCGGSGVALVWRMVVGLVLFSMGGVRGWSAWCAGVLEGARGRPGAARPSWKERDRPRARARRGL